jgi:hypothetical protein
MCRDNVVFDLPLARLAFPRPPWVATSVKSPRLFKSMPFQI